MVSNVVELYRFSIAYGGGNWFAAKKAIERGRARIIADKTKKDQRQSALSASTAFYGWRKKKDEER
jgi:hypothetical protein